MDKRIDYIDIAKAIGIILVYIGHCDLNYKSPLFLWIYSFHMPLFFFISGFLFKFHSQLSYDKIGKILYNKAISLLIPYLFFSIIQSITFILFNIPLHNWIIKGWGTNPLWFLPVLFLIEVLHLCITSNKKILIVASISIIIGLFIYKTQTNRWLPYSISEIPWFYICFLEGYLCTHILQRKHFSCIITLFLLFLHYLLLFIIIIPYNDNYRTQDNDILSYVYRIIIGLVGTISFIGVSQIVNKIHQTQLLKWIGKNTLVILCTHIMYIRILQQVGCGYFSYLLAWFLIIPSILLYNKYILPRITKLKKNIL
jgi:acyltransferase